MKTLPVLLALLVMPMVVASAAETCYDVDAVDGEVVFEAEQAGTPFSGGFREFGGEVCVDDAVGKGRLDVWLALSSVDSGLPELDAALQAREFFDTRNHPRAWFASDAVAKDARDEWQANGNLTLKGKTLPMSVPFTLVRDGEGYRASGELSFDRLDFDVGTGEWSDTDWLGETVTVKFRATLAPRK